MSCAYCGKTITEKEMKRETFFSIRQFRYGKNSERRFIDKGTSEVIHGRCFVLPSHAGEHPCAKGLVE